jgi:hypothetical protein
MSMLSSSAGLQSSRSQSPSSPKPIGPSPSNGIISERDEGSNSEHNFEIDEIDDVGGGFSVESGKGAMPIAPTAPAQHRRHKSASALGEEWNWLVCWCGGVVLCFMFVCCLCWVCFCDDLDFCLVVFRFIIAFFGTLVPSPKVLSLCARGEVAEKVLWLFAF